MSRISAGKAVRYAVLPGLWPRIKSLFFSSFGYLAYYIALLYAMVRLIPNGHAYLLSANIGKFGIRHVVGAASQNLRFSWRNIDQIIVFFGILSGIGILLLYMAGMVAFVLVSPAFASGLSGLFGGLFGSSGSVFETGMPAKDIAFKMMDRVFGVPGVFNSEVSAGSMGPWPSPFHYALHSLFHFFSTAMMIFAAFIFLYHATAVVLETTMTGTPFGRRFENAFVPIRIIVAVGLLVPVGYGLNSAQWITLYMAKYGSGAATNMWIKFNQATGETPLGGSGAVVAKPAEGDYAGLMKSLGLIRACIRTYEIVDKDSTDNNTKGGSRNVPPVGSVIRPYAVKGSASDIDLYDERQAGSNFDLHAKLLEFYGNEDIKIVFGKKSDEYVNSPGRVYPYCGEITIPVTSLNAEALFVQEGYLYSILRFIYPNLTRGGSGASAQALDEQYCVDRRIMDSETNGNVKKADKCFCDSNDDGFDDGGGGDLSHLGPCNKSVPYSYWQPSLKQAQDEMGFAVLAGYQHLSNQVPNISSATNGMYQQTYYKSMSGQYTAWLNSIRGSVNTAPVEMPLEVMQLGWGGAGVWYNNIAELNGSLIAAAKAVPIVTAMPAVMTDVAKARKRTDSTTNVGCGVYNPSLSSGNEISSSLKNAHDAGIANVLYKNCLYFYANPDLAVQPGKQQSQASGNPLINILNTLFGTEPLFDFRNNVETHPLAQLSALGRGLIEKAIMNYAVAAGTSAVGGASGFFTTNDKEASLMASASGLFSKAMVSFATIGITAGVILYYIVPLMPFMYFFFAVGRWVKTIFEAMVGVPLWALAHLTMGGNGLPGKAASNGYFLLFEILVRPMLTVFGLVASLSIFSAMITILNEMYDLATSQMTGHTYEDFKNSDENVITNIRSSVDQFFFMVTYVIICYMIATSSFKMIDLIPDNIMRWSGMGVQTFAPSDNADELVSQTTTYGTMGMTQFNSTVEATIETLGQATQKMTQMSKPPPAAEAAPEAPPPPPPPPGAKP